MKSFSPIAYQQCTASGVDFVEAFRYQYVISDVELQLPGFATHKLSSYVLQTGNALKCEELVDESGANFGYLFGVASSHNGWSAAKFLCDQFNAHQNLAISEFEERLCQLGGRFGVLVNIGGQDRLYVDASGMIGAKFDRIRRTVAATVGLCIDRLPKQTRIPASANASFGLHLTEDDGVERLNPNHYLDLKTFETARFWPREKDNFDLDQSDYAAAIDEIVDAVRNILNVTCRENKVSLPLSGGFDSRAIFSIADDTTLQNIEQIYTHILTKINITDASVANQLCALKGLGLEVHNALRNRRFSGLGDADLVAKQFEIASGGGATYHAFLPNGAAHRVGRDAVVLRGQQIPILRGLFVNNSDVGFWTSKTIADRVLELLHLNAVSEEVSQTLTEKVNNIYSELPENAKLRAIDLLLVESVNGPDLSSWGCGVSHSFYTSPFNSRRMIQLFASFDIRYRREGHAMHALLLRANPVLQTVARTPQVRTIRAFEEDDSVNRRAIAFARQNDNFEKVFGERLPKHRMIRFRTDGILERVRN